MTIPALILARGGSKGIPLKNLQEVGGRTLVGRTTREAIKSRFDPIYVWSDSDEVREEGDRYGALTPVRSPSASGDSVTTEDSVKEFLYQYGCRTWDALAVLQCTTPFLKSSHMNKAHDLFLQGKLDSVVSTTRFNRFLGYAGHTGRTSFVPMRPYRALRQEGGFIMEMENGGIYLAAIRLWNQGKRIGAACGVVEMGWWESLEIDEPEDLRVAQLIAPIMDDASKVRFTWD
jgi:CMP-N-acetylneuraminic acid synthetase